MEIEEPGCPPFQTVRNCSHSHLLRCIRTKRTARPRAQAIVRIAVKILDLHRFAKRGREHVDYDKNAAVAVVLYGWIRTTWPAPGRVLKFET